jgi:hypothetical protein
LTVAADRRRYSVAAFFGTGATALFLAGALATGFFTAAFDGAGAG